MASSQIAIIDRSAKPGARKVASTFFSHAREAHGLWTNPANNLLYVAHEQDELPGTPQAGQTVCTAFDVSDPFAPKFIAQIPHHEGAVDMARLVLQHGNDAVTRKLAEDIIASQMVEIEGMQRRLQDLKRGASRTAPGGYPALGGTRGVR